MIKCFFVDVNSISSDLPRSSFAEADLAQLAELILATDGLLRPLILKSSGVEKYTVLDGHREYYAVLKAKEKNSSKAEMVNAFVVGANIQQSAIEQLGLLTGAKSPTLSPLPESIPSIIEQLLPPLLATISQQIQPIIDQLAVQKQLLDTLILDVHSSVHVGVSLPLGTVSARAEELLQKQTLRYHQGTNITTDNLQLEIEKQPDPQPLNIPPLTTDPIVVDANPAKAVKVKPAKTTKPPAKSKKISTLPDSLDPTKATNTLNLINTLSEADLIQKMERSGVSKTVIKLVPTIIANRSTQPAQKFDTWEIVSATVKGLGATTIQKIIDKLK
jgi:hypothetical protein